MHVLSKSNENFYHMLKDGKDEGVLNLDLDVEKFTGRHVWVAGKKMLYFADCSYLGLENDSRLIEASKMAAENHGIILSNSRTFLSSPLYSQLQKELDQIVPGHSLITTTTTLGHASALPLLIGAKDLIIMDFHAHNSIQMAAKLCVQQGTKMKFLRYHNDMQKLEEMVNLEENAGYERIWFLGDGIYSMQGEYVDMEGLLKALDNNERLFTYLDDAHGFGWTGKNGAGYILGYRDELHPKMVVALSMCKAFGCAGGIIAFPNKALRDRVDLIGQTQVFSAPIPNPVLGAAIASAKIFQSDDLIQYQAELKELIDYFKAESINKGIDLNTNSNTPIQFIEIGSNEKVYEVSAQLREKGIYCSLAVYPAMPKKRGGLRVSLTRHLCKEDIDYLLQSLNEVLEVSPTVSY